MKTKTLLGISLAAIFVVSTLGMAYASGHLTIVDAEVRVKDHPKGNDSGVKFEVKTAGNIPTDGSDGMIGYGFLTDGNSLVITTSHAQLGLLDSAVQTAANDPAWHQHYAKLVEDLACPAGADPDGKGQEVADLSFASPGNPTTNPVAGIPKIDGNEAKITSIVLGEITTASSFGGDSTFTTGDPIGFSVLFHLDTATDPGSVCVVIDQVIASSD